MTSTPPEANDSCPFRSTHTGDVVFMNRKCWSMKDPLGIGLCLLTKIENRFDHVGMIVKLSQEELEVLPEAKKRIIELSPSDTYVLETNMKGVTLYSAEQRVLRSSAHEITTKPIVVHPSEVEALERKMLSCLEELFPVPYETNLAHFLPSVFSPPDKMDRIDAAKKINKLEHEIDALRSMCTGSPDRRDVYLSLIESYERTMAFLHKTYFPHLQRPDRALRSVDWTDGHLRVDGVNNAPQMVCSELIANLWLRAGLKTGFLPASSMRPFDLLDDDRFNFLHPTTHLGNMKPLKQQDSPPSDYPDSHLKKAMEFTESARLDFFNVEARLPRMVTSLDDLAALGRSGAEVFPEQWLVQSSDQDCVRFLGSRLFATGAIFSFFIFLCAPLTMRSMEHQAGLFLVRGSMWSLAVGVLARNLCFAGVQGMTACCLARLFYPTTKGVLFPGTPQATHVADWRHPFYAVVPLTLGSAAVAHVATTPLTNWNIARHFGAARPGPLSMRLLLRGSVALAPLGALLPFQAYWLGCYESVVPLLVPGRSTVLRPRPDLADRPECRRHRREALVGAMGTTAVVDAGLYAAERAVVRSYIAALYHPQASPSIGRRVFGGYRYRFASNILLFSASYATLSSIFHKV